MLSPPDDDRVEPIALEDDLPLFLRRGRASRGGPAVLLLHGASASCDTFLEPRGRSFFDFLTEKAKRDVWMLDWRGSFYNAHRDGANESADVVAREDIPYAIRQIRKARLADKGIGPEKNIDDRLTILGHCLGAACLAMSVGAGLISKDDVDRIIFSTIGLFYEVTWDGWTKVQDRILERVADQDPDFKAIGPDVSRGKWPSAMEETFRIWPETWGPPWQPPWSNEAEAADSDREFFQRLAFLFGQCFLVSNLHEKMTRAAVRKQFGHVPFKLYQHAAQNALRGFAAPFDAEGALDPGTANDDIADALAATYLQLTPFGDFDITLLTGADNPLWHRDAIDRMGEWLARLGPPPRKLVLDGYGHQDLWWGQKSFDDVFPLLFPVEPQVSGFSSSDGP
jgi:hypothetical protein